MNTLKTRLENGLCSICGQNPLCNKTECCSCREKRRTRQKASYQTSYSGIKIHDFKERIIHGLCYRCGKIPPEPTKKSCTFCLQKIKVREQELKDIVYTKYGGYHCACCGEETKQFLTLDHVENNGAVHRKQLKSRAPKMLYRWIIKNNFPTSFQVLCYNCNCGKARNNGVCPHKQEPESRL